MMCIRSLADFNKAPWGGGAITVTAQAHSSPKRHDETLQRSGDFYMATSGDLQLAATGDYLMATDTLKQHCRMSDHQVCGASQPKHPRATVSSEIISTTP